jgi:hypothetical protein
MLKISVITIKGNIISIKDAIIVEQRKLKALYDILQNKKLHLKNFPLFSSTFRVEKLKTLSSIFYPHQPICDEEES